MSHFCLQKSLIDILGGKIIVLIFEWQIMGGCFLFVLIIVIFNFFLQ